MRTWREVVCLRFVLRFLKVVFAGRGCCPGSIEGDGMNQGLLSAPMRIFPFPDEPGFAVHQSVV